MYNYDEDLIKKYIEGLDTAIPAEDLEKNYLFMMDVIKYTNDKKMYNMCSQEVRQNYDFVKFFMNKFSKELDNVFKVVDEYLKEEKDDVKKLDIVVKTYNLAKGKSEKANIYKLVLDLYYADKRLDFENYKRNSNEEDEQFVEEIGKGFLLFQDTYQYSEDLLNYFASKCISEIINYYGIDFEVVLHEQFKTFEDFEKYGVNNFIIKFLSGYDQYLAAYVANHLNVIENIKTNFNKIKANWSIFENQLKRRQYRLILDACYEYLDKNDPNLFYPRYSLIFEISKELGIDEDLKNYYIQAFSQFFGEDCGIPDDNEIFDPAYPQSDFLMKSLRSNVKKIMSEILNSKSPEKIDIVKDIYKETYPCDNKKKIKTFKKNISD